MTKKPDDRGPDERSPAGSIAGRLAVFAVLTGAVAGAVAGTVGFVLRRHTRRATEARAIADEDADVMIDAAYRLAGASVKPSLATIEPGREGIA